MPVMTGTFYRYNIFSLKRPLRMHFDVQGSYSEILREINHSSETNDVTNKMIQIHFATCLLINHPKIRQMTTSSGRKCIQINLVSHESCSNNNSAAWLGSFLCLRLKALSWCSVLPVVLASRSISKKKPPNIFRTERKARCLQSCVRASASWQMDVELLRAKHLVKLQTMRGLWILFIQQQLRWYLQSKSSYGPF